VFMKYTLFMNQKSTNTAYHKKNTRGNSVET
jgi:hypothetical protein